MEYTKQILFHISRKTYERNGTGKIVDNDTILWLSETHIEKGWIIKTRDKLWYNIIPIKENTDIN